MPEEQAATPISLVTVPTHQEHDGQSLLAL
jgi:hypothetical protein